MSGFLDDHDDFELARRLRRAAGATPDVYNAYDTVMSRVGLVRRRRRVATTGMAGLVLLLAATSYALNLRTSDHTIRTADATTDPSVTTEPIVLGPTSTASPSTVPADSGLAGGPEADDVTTTAPATTAPPESVDTEPADTAPIDTLATPTEASTETLQTAAPTLPPNSVTATTQKKPPTTKPPTTQAPATTPDTDPPSTAPPVATTVAPPPPTAPPTAPPVDTTAPAPSSSEAPVPVPVLSDSWSSVEGNYISVTYQNSQLTFTLLQPADGWMVADQATSAKKLKVTFAALDGSASISVTVTVESSKIRFS